MTTSNRDCAYRTAQSTYRGRYRSIGPWGAGLNAIANQPTAAPTFHGATNECAGVNRSDPDPCRATEKPANVHRDRRRRRAAIAQLAVVIQTPAFHATAA